MSDKRRVAIVAGLRTAFDRQLGFFDGLTALDMARPLIPELLYRTAVRAADLELLVFGSVLAEVSVPNIARELITTSGLSPATDAWSVSRACTTSLQATVLVASQIETAAIEIGIAGGSDSASCIPIQLQPVLARRLLKTRLAKSWIRKLKAWRGWSWRELALQAPTVRDYATGLSMGDAAEQLAQQFSISRTEQDEYAHQSHQKALVAQTGQQLAGQILRFYRPQGDYLDQDAVVRDSELASYQRLAPAFDRRFGTVTAANSCPLTDGAAALLLMSDAEATRRGLKPLGYMRAASQVALDPATQMLLGPAYAIPKVLAQAGLSAQDISLWELHEAFAAQVLANLKLLADPEFCQSQGLSDAVTIAPQHLNVLGGSLAYGHPFAATGARLILQGLAELQARQGRYLLVAACAAGGLGSAMILEAL